MEKTVTAKPLNLDEIDALMTDLIETVEYVGEPPNWRDMPDLEDEYDDEEDPDEEADEESEKADIDPGVLALEDEFALTADHLARFNVVTEQGVQSVRAADLFKQPVCPITVALNRKTAQNSIERVPLELLAPRQALIPIAGLKQYVTNPRRDPADVARVLTKNGERMVVQEGHTRLGAAILRGDTDMEVRVWQFVENARGEYEPVARGLHKQPRQWRHLSDRDEAAAHKKQWDTIGRKDVGARESTGTSKDLSPEEAALQTRLVDFKMSRELTGPGSATLGEVIAGAETTHFIRVPGLDVLHEAMGVEKPSMTTDAAAYSAARRQFLEKQPVETIPFGKLTFTQPRVNKARVEELAKLSPEILSKPVQILKNGSRYFVINGHHRVAASFVAGLKGVSGFVFDTTKKLSYREKLALMLRATADRDEAAAHKAQWDTRGRGRTPRTPVTRAASAIKAYRKDPKNPENIARVLKRLPAGFRAKLKAMQAGADDAAAELSALTGDTIAEMGGVLTSDYMGMADKPGVQAVNAAIKSEGRTIEKALDDYITDSALNPETKLADALAGIKDYVRTTVLVDNFDQMKRLVDKLSATGTLVRPPKDRFAKPLNGYRDILMNVRLSNGTVAEVQINLKSIFKIKEGPGHKIFEKVRVSKDQKQIDKWNAENEALYVDDWAKNHAANWKARGSKL